MSIGRKCKRSDLLWVTKLVAFKVEVTLTTQGVADESGESQLRVGSLYRQTYRIILCKAIPRSMTGVRGDKSDMLVSGKVSRASPAPNATLTHLGVHQPEGQRLVTDKRLIVTLGIGDTLLLVPSVGQDMRNVSNLPLVVCGLFEQLDPHVGNSHRQAVIESDTALWDRPAERGHARDIFCNGDGVGVEFGQHVVCLQAVSAERVWKAKDLPA
jgi:hypothetical protein